MVNDVSSDANHLHHQSFAQNVTIPPLTPSSAVELRLEEKEEELDSLQLINSINPIHEELSDIDDDDSPTTLTDQADPSSSVSN